MQGIKFCLKRTQPSSSPLYCTRLCLKMKFIGCYPGRCISIRWKREIASCTSLQARKSKQRMTTSSLFIPTRKLPEMQMASIPSHKLMLRAGLIRPTSSGVFHFLPMGLRVLDKLTQLIHSTMADIGAIKMAMPVLTPATLWRKSGRWDSMGHQLFRLQDWRGTEYCLGPTHEESITELVKQELSSSKQLPLKLYQLDRKFRDEDRPRYGLLRAREFWMKDLYTFDKTYGDALGSYHEVCQAYGSLLFDQLKLPAIKVKAATGQIGGSLSHEYHIPSAVGEDTLLTCNKCGAGASGELLGDTHVTRLPNCPHHDDHSPCQLSTCKGIEVAHSFLLGTKYSSTFDLTYTNRNGANRLVEMGCYGIGVSRLLAAVLEIGCQSGAEERMVWPRPIAPYHVCVLPMTQDTTDPLMKIGEDLYNTLQEVCPNDVLLEDRVHLTLGARRRDAEMMGYPVTVIIGHKTPEDHYEVNIQRTRDSWESHTVEICTLVDMVRTLYSDMCMASTIP